MGEELIETPGPKNKGGRPRKDRHLDDYQRHGPPPEGDLLALAEWCHAIVGTTAEQVVSGRGDRDTRQEIRSGAQAVAQLLPGALAADAQGLIPSDLDLTTQPSDPLLRIVWLARLLALDTWGVITGADRATSRTAARARERSTELRASARAMAKTLPPDSYIEARRALAQAAGVTATPTVTAEAKPWEDTGERPRSICIDEEE